MIDVYKASVANVRELTKQRTNIKRLINKSIKQNDHSSFNALTKLYALLYSSFAELSFLKTIHTPYGFNENEIGQISSEINLEQKWTKCLELAFSRINNIANAGEIQNKRQTLSRLIKQFIIEPSQLRNKIAHGQWIVALNNDNTAINQTTTTRIANLDFVKIDILFGAYEKIGQAVEDLIESPTKAHLNDFYYHMTKLEELINETGNWNLESKVQALKVKFDRIKLKQQINDSSKL